MSTVTITSTQSASRKGWLVFALALPLVALCLLIVRAELHVGQSQLWTFDVAGYDPRDLLRGHYLRINIRYDWQTERDRCNREADCCLCLTANGDKPPTVRPAACAVAKTQCDGYMHAHFRSQLNRFYVGEAEAMRAERILAAARADNAAQITLAINGAGKPQIVDLLIDGEPLSERLKRPDAPAAD